MKPLISFATSFYYQNYYPGTLYLGIINNTQVGGPFKNYTVKYDNGEWSFLLYNMAIAGATLGFNGLLTLATNSPYSVVPLGVFNTITDILGLSPSTFNIVGNLLISTFSCSLQNFPDGMPNVTYYVNGYDLPLILTPYQYVYQKGVDSCDLAIAGGLPGCPYTFTLSNMVLNNSYSFLDMSSKTFGIAPLALAP